MTPNAPAFATIVEGAGPLPDMIYLRLVESWDLEWIRQLRNDRETYIHLADPWPVTSHDQVKWLESLSRKDRIYFAACDRLSRIPVGLVRMDAIDLVNRSARIGADVIGEYRRRGYGSAIYRVLTAYCFETLGLNRLWLEVLETNKPAQHLYFKMGFVVEGTLRQAVWRGDQWVDSRIMGLLKSDPGR